MPKTRQTTCLGHFFRRSRHPSPSFVLRRLCCVHRCVDVVLVDTLKNKRTN